MKLVSNRVGVLATVLFFMVCKAIAVTTITYVGSQTSLPGWRDNTVAKTQDADGDNVYGTAGYALFAAAPSFSGGDFFSMSTALTSLPSYITISPISADYQFRHPAYADINDPTNVSGPSIDSGIAYLNNVAFAGNVYNLFSISFGAGAPDAMRIGMLMDVNEAYASPSALRLFQSGGGDSGTISKSQLNNQANFYFFDAISSSGSLSGQTFTFAATKGSLPGQDVVGISGFTFDQAVPEPSRMFLTLVGLVGIGLRRRRSLRGQC